MIKIFSNKTTTQKITIQSKFLKNKTTILNPNSSNKVNDVKSDTLLFVQIHVQGLKSSEKIRNLQLGIAYENTAKTATLKMINCDISDFNDSTIKNFAANLSGEEIVEDTQILNGNDHSLNEGIQVVRFDLTSLVKNLQEENASFTFVISNNQTLNGLSIYDPQKLSEEIECCQATMVYLEGLSSAYKYDEHEIEDTGKSYVNLYTQKLIHTFNGLSTWSKKAPITYYPIYSSQFPVSESNFDLSLTANFQYKIDDREDEIVIEDATGAGRYYYSISPTSDKGKALLKNYNREILLSGESLYYCDYDQSSLCFERTERYSMAELWDQKGNLMQFQIMLDNFTKLICIKYKDGDIINFYWSGNKLEKIVNSDNEEVHLTYNSINFLVKVDFISQHRFIQFDYFTQENKIMMTTYAYEENSTSTTKLKEIEINYQSNYLSKVIDKISGYQLNYQFQNKLVQRVTALNANNETIYYMNYISDDEVTSVTTYDNKKYYYYFDTSGSCKLEMDDQGRSITYNYEELENGEPKRLTSVSKLQTNARNFIENHSFENEIELFNSSSLGWKKQGDSLSKIKVISEGLYGEKCLFIDKHENETITISQNIVLDSGTYILKGFVKHQAKNTNESIVNGNIKMKISGTYIILEREEHGMIMVPVPKTYSFSGETTQTSGNIDWTKFATTAIQIPSGAINIQCKVEMIFSGIASEIYIDELQLSPMNQSSRYNLIENGYMDFVENSLPKGWNFENLEEEDQITTLNDNDEHASVLGKKAMKFAAGNVENESTKQFKIKKMYKTISCNGLSGESFIFSVFAKAYTSLGNVFQSFVKFYYSDRTPKTYYFQFDNHFKHWQVLTRSIIAEYNFDKIEVGIEYCGGNEALFDAFQLYKDSYGLYYNYDKVGNITEVINGEGTSMRIHYDENNKVQEIHSQDGGVLRYQYDSKGRLSQINDLSGNIMDVVYDENDFIKSTTLTTADGEKIIQSQTNDIWGNVLSSTDPYGKITQMGINNLNQMISITQPNGFKQEVEYNQDDSIAYLKAVLNNITHFNHFTYNEQKLVKSIASQNGSKYDMTYDNFGHLIKVTINGTTVNQWSYNEMKNGINKGLLSRKQYGDEGDYFDFDYDDQDQLIAVKLNNDPIIQYRYDEDGQIVEIEDIKNNIVKYFTYDLNGNITKVLKNDDLMSSYDYDHFNHLQKATYIFNQNNKKLHRSYDYEYDYETNEYTKEGYFNRIGKIFQDEIVLGGMKTNGIYGAKNSFKTCSQEYDKNLKMNVYTFEDKYDYIWYEMDTFNSNRTSGYSAGNVFNLNAWQKRFVYNKTFYMWMKPMGTYESIVLFKFLNVYQDDVTILSSLNVTSDGKIGYQADGETNYYIISDQKLKLNEWNLVGVKFFKKNNETKAKCVVFINDDWSNETIIEEPIHQFNRLLIGHQYTEFTGVQSLSANDGVINRDLNLKFNICMMSFGAYDYRAIDMQSIYKQGLKYFVSNGITKSSAVSYYHYNVYKDFDVISLNGSLESTYGLKPVLLQETDPSFKVEKARIFKYDEALKRHVYGAFSESESLSPGNQSALGYQFPLKNQGALSLRFKLEPSSSNNNRTIFTCNIGSTIRLRMVVLPTNHLRIIVFSKYFLNCDKVLELNRWYHTTVFFQDNQISVYIDGELLHTETVENSINIDQCTTYFGIDNEYLNPLNGCLEMIAYTDKLSTNQQIVAQDLYEKGKPIVIRNEMDSLGRVKKKVIDVNQNALETSYTYNHYQITKEEQFDGTSIEYTYDTMGYISSKTTKKENVVQSIENYEYDLLGRLIQETKSNGEVESFSYDTNGNIKTHQVTKNNTLLTNEEYLYDAIEKDRLNAILNKLNNTQTTTFTYDNFYKGAPTKIVQNGTSYNLTWEGSRLTKVNDVTYKYNEEGIRIKKSAANFITTFEVKNGRVLSMDYSNPGVGFTMIFNYDVNGELIGVSVDNKEFFYIKDLTGTIIKIVDEDGYNIVEYNYDAWGKIISKKSYADCAVSFYNPFVYKSYLYDSETGWYYLNSRYYNPELRRFISQDSIDYLNLNSINGLNLYACCNNDPVNYKQRPVSSNGSVISSSISVGGSSLSTGGSSGGGNLGGVSNPSAPWWASTVVGAIPDFILGMRYLAASGMHSKFAYATNTRYMHPIMGETWRWFGKSSSSFGTIAQGTFKQILTGDARAGFGAIAKSVGSVVGLNALVNFGFNLYENNWQVDSEMLLDTAIDTAIGVGSYYLAAGAMSLATAGLLVAGIALPGIIVVGGVVILSIGFEHVIRAIFGYWD